MQSSSGITQAASDVARGAAVQMGEAAGSRLQKLKSRTTNTFRNVMCCTGNIIKNFILRYPPVKTFFMLLLATSAFPFVAFVTFAGVTLGGLSMIAAAIVGTIESGLLAVAGTILGFVLVGCTIFSSFGVAVVSTVWVTWRIGKWALVNIGGISYSSGMKPVYGTYASGSGSGWYAAGEGVSTSAHPQFISVPTSSPTGAAASGISHTVSAGIPVSPGQAITEKLGQAVSGIASKTEELRQTGQQSRQD